MRDKVLFKGDITLQLEHGIEFAFPNVSQPKHHVRKMLALKDKHDVKREIENKPTHTGESMSDENISILTEALSEVVKEYLEKKR